MQHPQGVLTRTTNRQIVFHEHDNFLCQCTQHGLGKVNSPSTSFQTCTSSTPRAAPITVAVRSLPPLPSVVIAPVCQADFSQCL